MTNQRLRLIAINFCPLSAYIGSVARWWNTKLYSRRTCPWILIIWVIKEVSWEENKKSNHLSVFSFFSFQDKSKSLHSEFFFLSFLFLIKIEIVATLPIIYGSHKSSICIYIFWFKREIWMSWNESGPNNMCLYPFYILIYLDIKIDGQLYDRDI